MLDRQTSRSVVLQRPEARDFLVVLRGHARWESAEKFSIPPVPGRANRPGHKPDATIRTNIPQHLFDARRAAATAFPRPKPCGSDRGVHSELLFAKEEVIGGVRHTGHLPDDVQVRRAHPALIAPLVLADCVLFARGGQL